MELSKEIKLLNTIYNEEKEVFDIFDQHMHDLFDELGLSYAVSEDSEEYLELLKRLGEKLPEGAEEVREYLPGLKNLPKGKTNPYIKEIRKAITRRKKCNSLIKQEISAESLNPLWPVKKPLVNVAYGKVASSEFKPIEFRKKIKDLFCKKFLNFPCEETCFLNYGDLSTIISEKDPAGYLSLDMGELTYVIGNANPWFNKEFDSEDLWKYRKEFISEGEISLKLISGTSGDVLDRKSNGEIKDFYKRDFYFKNKTFSFTRGESTFITCLYELSNVAYYDLLKPKEYPIGLPSMGTDELLDKEVWG